MKKRLRIGLVLPGIPGYSETFFHSKIKGLQEAGYHVIVFTQQQKKEKTPYKLVRAWRISKNMVFLQLYYLMIGFIKLLVKSPGNISKFYKVEKREGKPLKRILEGIYINGHILQYRLDWLHFGFATMMVGRENVSAAIGAKMAVSFRGFDINVYPLKNPGIYHKIWSKLNKVHTISDDLYQKALALGLAKTTPYMKITPAIDIDKFHAANDKKKTGTIEITTVGRLHWIKGYIYAIEAMTILKESNVSFRYNIIGDGDEYEHLLFEIANRGLQDQVKLAGKKSPKEVSAYLNRSDIYLQPSIEEGFCNAVLEAQACGTLCVVSAAGGLKENVIDKVTGWVVPKRDPRAIAQKILQIMTMDPAECKAIKTQAIERIKRDFDIKQQIDRFLAFYE